MPPSFSYDATLSRPPTMDTISQSLHSYLVKLAYEGATHEQEHQMEHLLALLYPEDEQAVVCYYGLFGEPRLSLNEIAHKRGESQEQTMSQFYFFLRIEIIFLG